MPLRPGDYIILKDPCGLWPDVKLSSDGSRVEVAVGKSSGLHAVGCMLLVMGVYPTTYNDHGAIVVLVPHVGLRWTWPDQLFYVGNGTRTDCENVNV